jgi:2-polyprenyl-6-methoxyphenol hydroxylase-like FAD-dependent oxidoreductase
VSDSDYAELRLGCEVTSVEELAEGVKVQYICQNGPRAQLTGNFLVGADGKRGYVRKKHLEAKGIRQKVGMYVACLSLSQ